MVKNSILSIVSLLFCFLLSIRAYSQDFSKIKAVSSFSKEKLENANVTYQSTNPYQVFIQNYDPSNGAATFVSSNGVGYYSADDFQVSESCTIKTFETIGYQFVDTFQDLMTGVNIYIYEDDNAAPNGMPDLTREVLYHTKINKDETDKIKIDRIAEGVYHIVASIDFAAEAGKTYWLVFAPIIQFSGDGSLNPDEMFNQFMSMEANYNNAVFADAGNTYGLSSLGWISMYDAFGDVFGDVCKALSFALYTQDYLKTNEVVDNKTAVYPNPASNEFNISSHEFDFCEVYDATGKKVRTSKNPKVDVSQLSAGVYFVKIVLKNGKATTSKVIVRK